MARRAAIGVIKEHAVTKSKEHSVLVSVVHRH